MIWCVIAAVGMFVLATAAAVDGHGTTSAFLYGSAVMFAWSAGNLRSDRREGRR